MKKEIVRFATTVGLLATSLYAQQAVDSTSPASIRTTTVNELAADPSTYLGQLAVAGVVAAVKDTQGFTISSRSIWWRQLGHFAGGGRMLSDRLLRLTDAVDLY